MKTENTNWETCTTDELIELERDGTYMQRVIARRYLNSKRTDAVSRARAADECGDKPEADRMRQYAKYLGAPTP